ncbi:MAG: methyltransferase domain-containing protein [Lachnospiraceae bacterium]|nr:methyltransferase domain-containing protein [Lachnospiraceae bacterium]
MEAYTDFAYVYDTFMDETPYDKWRDFIVETIEKYGISKPVKRLESLREPRPLEADTLKEERNLILDLGCGTGTLTELLAEKGYDMIGVDSSADMLELAMEKRDSMGHETLYLLQDMRELELYGTVGTVVSVCDSLNYILSEEELLQVFKLVENYLFPEGIFIFDFNTVYKYAEVIGDVTIAENREACSFIWENTYYPEEALNEYEVTVFVRDGQEELYRKFSETHYQRGYTEEQMRRLLASAGMQTELVLDADTLKAASGTSERIYIVARCVKDKNRELL